MGVIEWSDVQAEWRRGGESTDCCDEWRIRDSNMGNESGWESRGGKQCGEEQWTDNRIDKCDCGWEDDWKCWIDSDVSDGWIRRSGKHVDIMDRSGVSARMGRRGTGRDSMDSRDGSSIGRSGKHEHVGEL